MRGDGESFQGLSGDTRNTGAQVGIRESLRGAQHFPPAPRLNTEAAASYLKVWIPKNLFLSGDFTLVPSGIQTMSKDTKIPVLVAFWRCINLNVEISKADVASHHSNYRHVAQASKTLLPWPGRSNLIVKCFTYLPCLFSFISSCVPSTLWIGAFTSSNDLDLNH